MSRIIHSMWSIVLMSGMCVFGHEALADEKLPINPGFKPAKKVDPKLPRVLLVGDSICGGYKRSVIRMLKNTANVDVWTTGVNLKKVNLEECQRQAMENGPYDVIHFNIGQHGLNRIASDEYEPLFRKYIATWKKYAPQSKLIWASTTPRTVRENHDEFDPVNNPMIVRRNAIAAKVAKESGIVVNDLYSIAAKRHDVFFMKDGIHLKGEAYSLVAKQISDVIVRALKHDNTEKHP